MKKLDPLLGRHWPSPTSVELPVKQVHQQGCCCHVPQGRKVQLRRLGQLLCFSANLDVFSSSSC